MSHLELLDWIEVYKLGLAWLEKGLRKVDEASGTLICMASVY